METATVEIVALGHAGDGATADGRFVPFTIPGDRVRLDENGRVVEFQARGAGCVAPVCAHFGVCGGCALQHLEPAAYRAFKRDLVLRALAHRGIENADVRDVVSVPPHSRRRAAFRAKKANGKTVLGFNERASHRIVDIGECPVLTPGLFACACGLRDAMASILRDGEQAELYLIECDNGFDLSLRFRRVQMPPVVAELARWAARLNILRITADTNIVIAHDAPVLGIAHSQVYLPPDCFLQPTREGESVLQSCVIDAGGGAKRAADLFCGVGTFALPLATRRAVLAVDGDAAMIEALTAGAHRTQRLKPVTAETRDLFRRPLAGPELDRFDLVVLDPPRSGAAAQACRLAESRVPRVVYVSCNPASFARDARSLIDGGYTLGPITPVDQFRWSAALELVAIFDR